MNLNSTLASVITKGETNIKWESLGVSIDSRTLEANNLFIALNGRNYNGHKFVKNAFIKGASAAVVNKREVTEELLKYPLLIVENTYKALIDLAIEARKNFKGKVIAVTGSVGKTSVKEMLKLALSSVTSVYANKGNYNNNIGMPLSLVNLKDTAQVAIFELGMNKPNEIAYLTNIVKPHIAIITEIALVHSEFFKNIEEIFLAKMEVVGGLQIPKILIFNYNSVFYKQVKEFSFKNNIHLYGFGEKVFNNDSLFNNESCKFTLVRNNVVTKDINKDKIFGQEITSTINDKSYTYYLPILGKHKALLSVLVLGIINLLGFNINKAISSLKNYKDLAGRGKVSKVSLYEGVNVWIIDDSYNASPLSMKKSILMLNDINSVGRKIIILGDMLELKDEIFEHKNLKEYILKVNPECVFALGKRMFHLIKELPNNIKKEHSLNIDILYQKLISYLQNNDILLIKGSLGSNIHKIVKKLKDINN